MAVFATPVEHLLYNLRRENMMVAVLNTGFKLIPFVFRSALETCKTASSPPERAAFRVREIIRDAGLHLALANILLVTAGN